MTPPKTTGTLFSLLTLSAVLLLTWFCHDTLAKDEAPAANYVNASLLAFPSELGSGSGMVIIDARSPEEYLAGHIPGAIHLWWKDCGTPNLLNVSSLEKILGDKGLSREQQMVVYDNARSSQGTAGRVFWMLEYLGCDSVRILNGGWSKWSADENPVETQTNRLEPATFTARVNPDCSAQKSTIQAKTQRHDFALIDARTDEEYNGWVLHGEKRGGHINTAISMNHCWFFNDDGTMRNYPALKELMDSHGVTPEKEVTAYSTWGVRSGTVYFALRLMGYPRCSNYDGSILDWCSDPALPMETMPRYDRLVYPAWVDTLLKGGNPGTPGQPQTYSGSHYVIVHASSLYWKGASNPAGYDPQADYDSGHIPTAISIPLHLFDTVQEKGIYPWTRPEDGNLLPPEQLKSVIERHGIRHDDTVIVYCGNKSYIGGAYRIAWALMYAGVKDVRYLNGDLAAWVADGGALETTPNRPEPVADFGTRVPAHPEYLATTEQVQAMISDANSVIADDRSWTEFSARDKSGCYYDFFCSPGHVPGATWVQDMYWYLDSFTSWRKPGYYKPASLKSHTLVKQAWEKHGITPDKKIAFYCGGGWRSSLVWFYAYLLGYPDIGNYDGGWYEWTWDTARAVELGDQGQASGN